MKEETLIKEISDTVERMWVDAPPKIVLEGWWWKRYVPFFRRQAKIVANMWEDQWGNGGREAHREMLESERRREARKYIKEDN